MLKLYKCVAIGYDSDITDTLPANSKEEAETLFKSKLDEHETEYIRVYVDELLIDGYEIIVNKK